ncbi:ABC transporter substrate-binding protein [Cohnella sp. GCM10027633]|uniref:ABC transporter substrate-binding protein n=1 Tax=unclassified Cohnella TaxID=2636738 RepID=UPI00363E40F4
MRKSSLVITSLLALSTVLAACGGNNDNNNTASPSASTPAASSDAPAESSAAPSEDITQKKVTISIYYPTPDRVEDRKLEDDKIARFNQVYPNVEVVKSDWQYNPNEIGIKMGANEAPTLFNTYATEGKFLAEKGWAADITDLWNAYEKKEQFNPILANQFILDGKVFGIPQRGYVVGTVVNTKMLKDKGIAVPAFNWTWDDMLNTAKAATDAGAGISGIAPMGKGNEAGWNWTNFLFEAGGEIQTVADGKVTAAFNSDAGLKALEFYNKLQWEAKAIPADWALGWGDAVGAFAQGRTAMVIAGPDGPVDQGLNQGGMKPEDLAVYPMPAAQAGGKHTGVLGGDFLVINPNASKDEQQIAFAYAVFDYFSDKGLASLDANIQARKGENKYFIPPVIEYFKMDSEYGQKVKAVYDKYDNVYQYSPDIMTLLDGKPEAQYNTQDYYAAMTNVIQEVFSKEGVDLKGQLDAAAKLVQEKFYDTIQP